MTLPPSPTFQQSEDDYTGPNGQKLTIRVIDLSREPNIAQSNLDSVFTPEEFALIKQQSQATSKPILDPLPYPDRFFVAGFLTATKWLHNVKVAKLGPITGVVSETDTPGGTGYFFEGEKGNRIYTVLGSGMGADDVKAVAGSLVPQ